MSEIVTAKTSEISIKEKSIVAELKSKSVKIRVSPNSYFISLFLATFFAGFLAYMRYDKSALVLFVSSLVLIPILIWTDRLIFDGKKITRTGLLPRFWAKLNSTQYSLGLD